MKYIEQISALPCPDRIQALKEEMLAEPRFATIEQARIITKSYKQNEEKPRCIQRAHYGCGIAHIGKKRTQCKLSALITLNLK